MSKLCYGILLKSSELIILNGPYKILPYNANKGSIKSGDTLTIQFIDKKLSFIHNEKNLGVAYNDLEGPFYLFAYCYSKNDKLTINEIKLL